jgi:hypothetical protein
MDARFDGTAVGVLVAKHTQACNSTLTPERIPALRGSLSLPPTFAGVAVCLLTVPMDFVLMLETENPLIKLARQRPN